MKILSPINCAKEVRQIIDNGADELYCGVLSKNWNKNFTNVGSINRREFAASNMQSYEELKEAVKEAHNSNVKVFLTMNGLYSEEQYPQVFSELEEAKSCDVDGFIVADLGLLLQLKGQGLELHLSTGGTMFNSEDVKFFKRLGISKITIPRHMSLKEIKKLVQKNKGTEFDVFIMNTRCMNIDGFCTFQHGINELKYGFLGKFLKKVKFDHFVINLIEKNPKLIRYLKNILSSTSACHLNYNISIVKGPQNKKVKKNITSVFGLNFLPNACGACALYDFEKIGISSLKIVGRENPTSKKIKDVQYLRNLLNSLEKRPSRIDFYQKAKKEYQNIYRRNCSKKLCYYP